MEVVALVSGLEAVAAFELTEQARLDASRRSFRVRDTDEPLGQITFTAGIATSMNDQRSRSAIESSALLRQKREKLHALFRIGPT